MTPVQSACVNTVVPLIFGIAGFLRLGRFDWTLAIVLAVVIPLAFIWSLQRARFEQKYGKLKVNSVLFGRKR